MQLQMTDARAGAVFGFAILGSLIQFALFVLALLAMRRMAVAQETTARHLETLVARPEINRDPGAAR